MDARRIIVAGVMVLCVGACDVRPEADRPAVVAEQTPAGIAELREVVQSALGRTDIRLADTALTDSSILALERGAAAGAVATGRTVELPERFELVENAGRCYLIRVTSGERYRLRDISCTLVTR